jgi:LmbE family N-acetylglucosaminyl deacetylase
VLICAAHSDDCVILGAEYAWGVVERGLSINVAYLTCSGPAPDTEISRVRREEAFAAWSSIGVPKENFAFANLPESPVKGPSRYAREEVVRAREIFKVAILSLPVNSAIIVPADGEFHIDHRTLRSICFEALVDSGRIDLIVYESPEYNSFLSLLHSPRRTIRTVLRHVPLLGRLVEPYAGSPNYINGQPGYVFRDTPGRLEMKKKLLTYFASQDVDLLHCYFGYEAPYRPVALTDPIIRQNRLCISAFGSCCGLSVLVLGFAVLGVVFLTAHAVARELTFALAAALPVDKGLILLGIVVVITYLVRRIRRTVNFETFILACVAAVGLISGAFLRY